jgi:hypothetical protein
MSQAESTTIINQTIECKANELAQPIKILIGQLTGLLQVTLTLDEKIQTMADQFETVYKITKHIHDSHLHPFPHEAQDEYEVQMGGNVYPDFIGPADRLITEFNNSVDVDGNGLIYGVDFIINSDDQDKPCTLDDLEMAISQECLNRMAKLSWKEFLETLSQEMRDYYNV